MGDVLNTLLDFIEDPQSYEGFRGHRGRDSKDNSNSHLKGEIPGSGQASKE